jgi:hypothetical protein
MGDGWVNGVVGMGLQIFLRSALSLAYESCNVKAIVLQKLRRAWGA